MSDFDILQNYQTSLIGIASIHISNILLYDRQYGDVIQHREMGRPVSFIIDFAAQQYGMFSSPNMLDVHNQNLSFFSPYPYGIAAFFFPQQLFQVAWLYRLYKLNPTIPSERVELDQMVDFVPYYSVGNLCIATWMIFWNSSRLEIANIFVCINSFTQLYYITARLAPMNTKSRSSWLTHVVAKTFAGIGVLDFLHNTSVAYFKDQSPTTAIMALTGVGFGLGAAASDWIFGGCLVYDLAIMAVGQSMYNNPNWSKLLGVYALGAAGIVAARNLSPPYNKSEGYVAAPEEEA